jgi:hypothetical protein
VMTVCVPCRGRLQDVWSVRPFPSLSPTVGVPPCRPLRRVARRVVCRRRPYARAGAVQRGGVVHQSLASPSSRTPCEKATPEKIFLYEQTPRRATSAFAPAAVGLN